MQYVVRPVPHHFIVWLLLAPLLLVEVNALHAFLQTLALHDPARVRTATATIVDSRQGARRTEVRYQFEVPGHGEPYYPRGFTGFGRQWVAIDDEIWQRARQEDMQLAVTYLPEDPWTNQPLGRRGYPVADSFLLWLIFFVFDIVWLAETAIIARNYVRCLAAAERRTPHRARFWRARAVLDPRYQLIGWPGDKVTG